MSHLASTMRKIEEAEGAALPRVKLPGIGAGVRFTLRGKEFRNGANCFAGVVTREHPETGLIDILVLLDADDYMSQRDVPKMTDENGWGWQPTDDAAARALTAFKEELAEVIFGDGVKAEESIYDMIANLDMRMAALEGRPAAKV